MPHGIKKSLFEIAIHTRFIWTQDIFLDSESPRARSSKSVKSILSTLLQLEKGEYFYEILQYFWVFRVR